MPGPAGEHLPAGPLEQAEERRLIEMPEGVALVGVDGEVDLGSGMVIKIATGGDDGEERREQNRVAQLHFDDLRMSRLSDHCLSPPLHAL